MTHGGSQTWSGSGPSFLDKLEVSEWKVQRKPGNRGGGASLQVTPESSDDQHPSEFSLTPPVCFSGVDDAESECGLDRDVKFDWIIRNDGDASSLDEQLQPILKLAQEAATSSSSADHH